jgi:hypothetical protein
VAHRDGYFEEHPLEGPISVEGSRGGRMGATPIQAVGLTVTYLKRALIKMVLNLVTADDPTDDDGEGQRRSHVQRPLVEDRDENQPPPTSGNGAAMQRWLDKMVGQLNAVTSLAEATKLLASADVTAADERLKVSHPEIWAEFDAARCAMVDKYWPIAGMNE